VPVSLRLRTFALVLTGLLSTAFPSTAEEAKCIPRHGNFPLGPNEHFAGLFRVPLHSPDLNDREAIRRHLIFLETWSDIILKEMPLLCGALAIPIRFPDLRVFLKVSRTGVKVDREIAYCRFVLEDYLQHSKPGDEIIKQAAESNAYFREPKPVSNGRTEFSDAGAILQAALPLIYEKGSLLHTLTSLEWTSFASVDGAEFRAWLASQRLPKRPLLESMERCLPPRDRPDEFSTVPRERAESPILPPGEIDLSRGPDGPLRSGPLRYAVIVGNPDEPPVGMVASEVKVKYCNREHVFSIGGELTSVKARPRCVSTEVYDLDAWTLIYCDPADCTSEDTEKAVMSVVAHDAEVLDFAQRSAATTAPRGPYFVTIK
jgi:hypothetical protein